MLCSLVLKYYRKYEKISIYTFQYFPIVKGHVHQWSTSLHTLIESRYTLKGKYNIGNVGKTASMSMLTLFDSRYTLKGRYNIGNVGKTASMKYAYSLWIKIYIDGKVQHW